MRNRYRVRLDKDIRKATIVKTDRGEPDIEIESPLGESSRISRIRFKEEYKDLKNKKIKMLTWRRGRGRLVIKNSMGIEGIAEYTKGVYKVSIGGGTYRVPKKWFRKMFVVMDKVEDISKGSTVAERKSKEEVSSNSRRNMGMQIRLGGDGVDGKNTGNIKSGRSESMSGVQKWIVETIVNTKGRKTYICNSGRERREIGQNELVELCQMNKVKNVCVVTSNGKKFLRGVGCKLNELPKIER